DRDPPTRTAAEHAGGRGHPLDDPGAPRRGGAPGSDVRAGGRAGRREPGDRVPALPLRPGPRRRGARDARAAGAASRGCPPIGPRRVPGGGAGARGGRPHDALEPPDAPAAGRVGRGPRVPRAGPPCARRPRPRRGRGHRAVRRRARGAAVGPRPGARRRRADRPDRLPRADRRRRRRCAPDARGAALRPPGRGRGRPGPGTEPV
ncbi:MAG: hypothetical protein AVDCRST_MAG79-740, partial [uncultured Thermoleophilia bacterium]